MKFRHEWKHEISVFDREQLRARLPLIMKQDKHGVNGTYEIRSLYFDNVYDKALMEKINGVNYREKFRIRYYDGDVSYIRLEKKSKINDLCNKEQAVISAEQAQALADNDWTLAERTDNPLITELCSKMKSQGLRAKTIVEYTRDSFTYKPGNVRVTIDYNIRTGMQCTDFLNRSCVTVPASGSTIILEVKWDEFLPSTIRDAVQIPSTRSGAYSKYAACRIYG